MSDWEQEFEEEEKKEKIEKENKEKESKEEKNKKEKEDKNKKEEKKEIQNSYADESEEITVTKTVDKGPIRKKEKPVDYEKKYQEKKKDDIKFEKEIEESVKNIKDPELRLKKKLELMELKRGEKFLEGNNKKENKKESKKEEDTNIELNVEKDFIQLAQKNAAKINSANKLPLYTLSYLKNSVELLGPSLSTEMLRGLMDSISVIYNMKLKADGNKKKTNKNPSIKMGKSITRDEKKGLYRAYGGEEQEEEEEEEYNDDDFM